jgi:hypothetical protein
MRKRSLSCIKDTTDSKYCSLFTGPRVLADAICGGRLKTRSKTRCQRKRKAKGKMESKIVKQLQNGKNKGKRSKFRHFRQENIILLGVGEYYYRTPI